MDPLQAGDPEYVGRYRMLGRLGEGGMGWANPAIASGVEALDRVVGENRVEHRDRPGRAGQVLVAGHTQVITGFTMARASFLEGQQVVAASDPLTDEAHSTGVDRFADGTRNLALAGTVTEGIPALPPEYSAAGLADPACDE